jgi:hypothetical protein
MGDFKNRQTLLDSSMRKTCKIYEKKRNVTKIEGGCEDAPNLEIILPSEVEQGSRKRVLSKFGKLCWNKA